MPDAIDGFATYRMNGQPLGDFSGFKTVYRRIDGGVQLSDDGSVWQEPEQIDVPERTKPTAEERIAALEERNAYLEEALSLLLSGETEEVTDNA